jgi:putative transferase (TIGR04331 family)
MAEAVESLRSDAGNRALVGAIAAAHGLAVEPFEPPAPPRGGPRRHARHDARAIARHGAIWAEAALLSRARRAPTTLVGIDPLRRGDALRLAARGARLWLAPPWTPAAAPAAAPTDGAARERFAFASTEPVAAALWALLPRLLPRSVLEGRGETVAESRRRYGPARHVVVNNYAADEVQNAYLVACRAAGRRITFAQHGGFYHQAPVNAQEPLEVRPGHTFLSWGARGEGIVPAPSPRLATLRDRHRGGTQIVLVENLQPPDTYVIRFASHPLANQVHAHDRQLVELLGRVTPSTRDRMLLKRFPSHLPGDTRAPELAALPHQGPVRSRRAVDWMTHARLAVISYPDTPFIEAMLLGVPTIGLWPGWLWELRDDAREPFELLAAAGVVFDDPAAAAAQLDGVAADPARWWRSEQVQAARRAFLARFAAVGPRPLEPWIAHLRWLRGA